MWISGIGFRVWVSGLDFRIGIQVWNSGFGFRVWISDWDFRVGFLAGGTAGRGMGEPRANKFRRLIYRGEPLGGSWGNRGPTGTEPRINTLCKNPLRFGNLVRELPFYHLSNLVRTHLWPTSLMDEVRPWRHSECNRGTRGVVAAGYAFSIAL